MALPFFFIAQQASLGLLLLNEETSKHIVQVLRMEKNEPLRLTDGVGHTYHCIIVDDHRKKCTVEVQKITFEERKKRSITIAISPVKNNTRFEWFLEKATEIGVAQIVPLICQRTEKQHIKFDRLQSIVISAMLQSQQTWLPEFSSAVKFDQFITTHQSAKKYIAHCEDETAKTTLAKQLIANDTSVVILIGPEGDFSVPEIEQAKKHHYLPVSLGETRLRTETAGIVAAAILQNF